LQDTNGSLLSKNPTIVFVLGEQWLIAFKSTYLHSHFLLNELLVKSCCIRLFLLNTYAFFIAPIYLYNKVVLWLIHKYLQLIVLSFVTDKSFVLVLNGPPQVDGGIWPLGLVGPRPDTEFSKSNNYPRVVVVSHLFWY
jgi:hypothetical protein